MIAAGLVSLLWNAVPNTGEFYAAYQTASILRYLGLTVFAIITGIMVDRIGRKKPIIVGLVMLGAAYAVVGLLLTPVAFFVNLLLSGLAWGIIMVVYRSSRRPIVFWF
jgi:MFS family permease